MRAVQMLRVAASLSFVAPLIAILITLIIRGNVPDAPARFTAMGMALWFTCLFGFLLSVVVLSNRVLVRGTSSVRRAVIGAAANGALLILPGLSAF